MVVLTQRAGIEKVVDLSHILALGDYVVRQGAGDLGEDAAHFFDVGSALQGRNLGASARNQFAAQLALARG